MSEAIEVNLPTFALLEGPDYDDESIELWGRYVIIHIPTKTIVEIFERDRFTPNPNLDLVTLKFVYIDPRGNRKKMLMLLHSAPTLDKYQDREFMKKNIFKPACEWFCDYCDWLETSEDENAEKIY